MSTIAQEILAIATEHGYTGSAQSTIAGAINVLADTLAGSDATDGGTIASAIRTLAPYIGGGGGGGSFGEMQYCPQTTSTTPTVGESAVGTEAAKVAIVGTSADDPIVSGDGADMGITSVASGLYLTVMPDASDTTTAVGYVCTVNFGEFEYAAVTQWDGTITLDTTSVEDYNCFGFTMPELEQGEFLVLVFSGSTD